MRIAALGGMLLLLVLWPCVLLAEDFQVARAESRLSEGVYLLEARIDYRFNETVLEALEHGVPLTLEVHIQVRRDGAWVWEQDVAELRLRYLISYRALTSLYEVTDLSQDNSRSFVTRDAALTFLGEINGLPLVDQRQLAEGEQYLFELRAQLDIEALPLPLRPLAYLTPAWNLSSGWSSWPLQP